jgi:MoaA/NifB/PqqE/SkfB family radical SAM enzyme
MKEIHLEVTLKCPFNCVHCSGFANMSHKHISFSTIKKRLEKLQIIKKKIAELVITGGEPTTRNDLPEILKNARGFCNNLSLFTTGSNGRSKLGDNYWNHLKFSGLNTVVFSVHSIDHRINDKFFGEKITKTTLNSILSANKAGLISEINCVLTKMNILTLNETVESLLSIYGASKIRLLRFVSQGRGANCFDKYGVNANTIEALIKYLKTRFEEKVHFEGFPKLHRCRSNHHIGDGCQFGNGLIYIDVNGVILPCPAVKQNSNTIIGKLEETKDIKKIFRSGVSCAKRIDAKLDQFWCLSQAS